jgi:hypothetical protein
MAAIELAQIPCSGVLQRYHDDDWPFPYDGRQAYEDVIAAHAIRSTWKQVYEGTGHPHDAALATFLDGAYRSFTGPLGWVDGAGPWFQHAVVDGSGALLCDGLPADGGSFVDTFYIPSTLGLAFGDSGDATFLVRALELAGSTAALQAMLEDHGEGHNLENSADLLRVGQDLDWAL